MKNTNSNIAYDYIRKRILAGEYAPGASLATNTLSLNIGVSRTPVRDALRQLEADGLVTIQPHLGARVTNMDADEFREMCELRLALESYAAHWAALKRRPTDLRELEHAVEEMRRITSQLSTGTEEEVHLSELRKADIRFHIAVMSAAQNELMKREILRLHLVNRVVITPKPLLRTLPKNEEETHRREVLASHEEILEAIKSGNSNAAKTAMERHIQDIIDKNIRAMEGDAKNGEGRKLTEEELSYGG